MTSPICMNGHTTKFTVSWLKALSRRLSMKFGGANSANIFVMESLAPPSLGGGRALDRQAREVNHLQLVRVVVGDEERLPVGRLAEFAREDAGRDAARDGRPPLADARGVDHRQSLSRRLVAREAVRVGHDDPAAAAHD